VRLTRKGTESKFDAIQITGFFFFFVDSAGFLTQGLILLGFKLRASGLQSKHSIAQATPPVHFALVILEMGVSRTICPNWPQTAILPISNSQVARIIGVSHQHLALKLYLNIQSNFANRV
jgi:hypothetical protein